MIVIYHDVGGTHSAAVAANIHINRLPYEPVPNKSALFNLPTFDTVEKKDWGHLIYIGDDELGAGVYTISRQRAPEIVIPAITGMYNILNHTSANEGLYLVDTTSSINIWMKIGGLLSRRIGAVSVGRPIAVYGSLQAYKDIAGIVEQAKRKMKEDIGRH